MKYVAFLDILGFKEKLKSMKQQEATQFIGHFSATAYAIWRKFNPTHIKGYLVSDSFIIYSNDDYQESLSELIHVVVAICKEEFFQHSIILRGAVAKGEFDKLVAREMSSLQKGLIVGQAYVDAYLLEGTVKTTGIVFSNDTYHDVINMGEFEREILMESVNGKNHYVLRYLTIDHFLQEETVRKFVRLANTAKWLPHYYNSIYLALKNETNENKVKQVFINLLNSVSEDRPNDNWQKVDLFIENAFAEAVFSNFKTRFLKFIRKSLFASL